MKLTAPKLTIPAVIMILLSCFTSGCVTYTRVKDEPRQSIRFGNLQAAQSFYEAYIFSISSKRRASLEISVPLYLPYWQRTVSTDNVRFNAAVRLADSNHDGIISNTEALAYAAKVRIKSTKSNKDFIRR